MDVAGKKIFVGLSGGVDSAVSAALLVGAGAEVTGVFIRGWYPPGMPCTWAEDRRDAMRVAAHLGIPFRTLDASTEYKKSVIDYLLREYGAGRTPNPDVMCNREVKFGAFYRYAISEGADAIATGHYRSGEKDQTYFLWAVPREILESAVFPVGHMDKDAVRALARELGLPVARKRDSQGICFLGNVSVEEFLKSEFGQKPGVAFDIRGTEVGEHDGVLLHTLGERISLRNARSGGPWYVFSKNISKNELVVYRQEEKRAVAQRMEIVFTHENWIQDPSRAIQAQYRYRGPLVTGHIDRNRFIPNSSLPELATAGQSIVFYGPERDLVGGGIMT